MQRPLKRALVAAIAGVVGTANAALYVNPDGTGQILLYPYYTVNKGLQTIVSIVNTTDQGKAVKVRFLEGRNSREVLDFNLYLSPFDIWTAAVTAASSSDTSPARLVTQDKSCTSPTIPSAGVDFRNFAYAFPPDQDSGPTGLERTREGYLEVIEMGVIDDERASSFTPLTWITHVNGVPNNCNRINQSWSPGGEWFTNRHRAVTAPTGGLFGNAAIVDVDSGVMYSFVAEAIDGARVTPNHQRPGTIFPRLSDIDTNPPNSSVVFYAGAAVTSQFSTDIDAVSSVLMQNWIANEYYLDPVIGADTEWVITFPTKSYYTDPFYSIARPPVAPFTSVFPPAGSASPNLGRACEDVTLRIYDREEQTPSDGEDGGIDFSPPPPGSAGPQLCFEAQVLTFNQRNRVMAGQSSLLLGSNLYTNVEPADFGFTNGWLSVGFTSPGHALGPSLEGNIFYGLPAIGFAVSRFVNNNARPGVLANYSGAWRHRGSRLIENTLPRSN